MPWVPIHESSVGFTFYPMGGLSSLEGSTVSFQVPGSPADSDWTISFSPAYDGQLRITALEYMAGQGGSGSNYEPALFTSGAGDQVNEAPPFPATTYPDDSGVTAFLPSPVEISAPGVSVQYLATLSTLDNVPDDRSFSFLVEVWEEPGPEPPGEEYPVYVVRGTHRAYMGTDSPQTAWIRDEGGRHDLTQYEEIVVEVKSMGRDRPNLTLTATGSAEGELEFTVTADGARKRLWPGVFNLFAKADGKVIYTGLLELLA